MISLNLLLACCNSIVEVELNIFIIKLRYFPDMID